MKLEDFGCIYMVTYTISVRLGERLNKVRKNAYFTCGYRPYNNYESIACYAVTENNFIRKVYQHFVLLFLSEHLSTALIYT